MTRGKREDLDALMARRTELDEQHEQAVALLEQEGHERSLINRRKCAAIYDERAALQLRIDAHLARERAK